MLTDFSKYGKRSHSLCHSLGITWRNNQPDTNLMRFVITWSDRFKAIEQLKISETEFVRQEFVCIYHTSSTTILPNNKYCQQASNYLHIPLSSEFDSTHLCYHSVCTATKIVWPMLSSVGAVDIICASWFISVYGMCTISTVLDSKFCTDLPSSMVCCVCAILQSLLLVYLF